MDKKKDNIFVNLYFSNVLENMVKMSVDKINRKFWMPIIGSALAIKRLSIKGCLVEHYEVIDSNYRFHIYQFHRKKDNWVTKNIESGGVDVSDQELTLLREILNVVDIYDHLENIWLLLYLLGLNDKICVDIVGYTFGLYFQKKSYNLRVLKI